ncbi:MAG: hypothetical protein LAT76_04130 [Schleiferiaceae bacterium]|nr:hypothetical protein [Schleiferiaceae bacterium]
MFESLKALPLFPLGIFILPGDYTQLHIFEERYKELVHDLSENGTTFGILSTNKLNTENYGSQMRLVEITKTYPNGEMDILVKCESIFELHEYQHQMTGKRYPGGTIKTLHHIHNAHASNMLLAEFQVLEQQRDVETGLRKNVGKGILDIANELDLADDEKLKFAQLNKKEDQERFLLRQIMYVHKLHEQETVTRYLGFYLN